MNKLEYKQYLNSKHWKNIKLKIYKSHPKCKFCNRESWLNIHHKTYKNIGCEKKKDLIVLCKYCHHYLHSEISDNNGNISLRDWLNGKRKKVVKKLSFNIFVNEYKKSMKTRNFDLVIKMKNELDIDNLDFYQKKQFEIICLKLIKQEKK